MNKKTMDALWKSIKKLQGQNTIEEFMDVVTGIIFLKLISEKYDFAVKQLKMNYPDKWERQIKDIDILAADYGCSFIVPKEASWNYISEYTSSNEIGQIFDTSITMLEESNEKLKGLLNTIYNVKKQDQVDLGKIVSKFSNLPKENSIENIGQIFKFFIEKFYLETKMKESQLYTPESIVNLMVELIDPKNGTLYDPVCGTGGFLVKSFERMRERSTEDCLTFYGQEIEDKTWKKAKLNLLVNEVKVVDINLGNKADDTLRNDQHPNITFDYILADPVFNQKDWGYDELKDDPRWKWGMPKENNANYAWLSHIVYKLDSVKGKAAILLSNGSLSGANKAEIDFRENIVKSNKLEAIISLPNKMFSKNNMQSAIWIINNSKKINSFLFINASEIEGKMISKNLRVFEEKDINLIMQEIIDFREGKCIDKVGFSKVVSDQELMECNYSFVPGRYVGFIKEEINKEKLKDELKESSKELKQLFKELTDLMPEVEEAIEKALIYKEEN